MPRSSVWWVSSLRSTTERRVLGLEAVQGGGQLVVVGLGAGLDGDRRARPGGGSTAGTRTGVPFGASVSPVRGVGQLGHGGDVAGHDLGRPASCSLPRRRNRPWSRSSAPVRGLTSWSSALIVPDSTLNSESWPT